MPAFCGHLFKDNGLRYDENFQLNKTKRLVSEPGIVWRTTLAGMA